MLGALNSESFFFLEQISDEKQKWVRVRWILCSRAVNVIRRSIASSWEQRRWSSNCRPAAAVVVS